VVGGSWFVYALYGVPGSPLRAVIQQDITFKAYGATPDPFYYYFVFLLGTFVPWILYLLYKPKRWLHSAVSADRMFLACAFGVPLIIMSCFAAKNGKYILPLFPFLAVFLGCAVSDVYTDFSQRWGGRFHSLFIRCSGGLLAILFVVMVLAPPYIHKHRFVTLKPFAEKLRSMHGESPVFSYRHEHIQLIYYYGEPISVLDPALLKEKLSQGKSFLLVADDRDRVAVHYNELCLLEEFSPYLRKNRKGLLYGTYEFCQLASEESKASIAYAIRKEDQK
jgi:hypothetical protein